MLLLFYKKYVIIYKKDFYKSNRGSGKRDAYSLILDGARAHHT